MIGNSANVGNNLWTSVEMYPQCNNSGVVAPFCLFMSKGIAFTVNKVTVVADFQL
jgi:hypothetical protein